jgi:hypothetical protein
MLATRSWRRRELSSTAANQSAVSAGIVLSFIVFPFDMPDSTSPRGEMPAPAHTGLDGRHRTRLWLQVV